MSKSKAIVSDDGTGMVFCSSATPSESWVVMTAINKATGPLPQEATPGATEARGWMKASTDDERRLGLAERRERRKKRDAEMRLVYQGGRWRRGRGESSMSEMRVVVVLC